MLNDTFASNCSAIHPGSSIHSIATASPTRKGFRFSRYGVEKIGYALGTGMLSKRVMLWCSFDMVHFLFEGLQFILPSLSEVGCDTLE